MNKGHRLSAFRALPEGSDTIDEMATVGAVEMGRARRAPIGEARRSLNTDEWQSKGCARRALVDLDLAQPVAASVTATTERATDPAVAFVAPRRPRFAGRRVAAAVGLLAVVGSLSGAAVSGSAAMPALSSGAATVQVADRTASVSRDATRPDSAQTLFPSTSASGSLPTPAADSFTATTLEPAATADSSNPTTAEASAAAVEPAAAAPAPSVATNIAAGQLSPSSVEEALAKAESMTGNWNYQNMCLSLVATFYGYTSAGEVGAQQAAATAAAAGQLHTDMSNIPVGALIWYDGTPVGNPYGHVAMYAGDGMVYSNGAPTGVGLIPINEPADGWREPIIGWSSVWLPAATK